MCIVSCVPDPCFEWFLYGFLRPESLVLYFVFEFESC
jgi:hypothetical protein